MICVLFPYVFDAKIVDTEGEADGVPFVGPKTWGELALLVAVFVEAFLEQLLGNQAGLWEAIHSLFNFDVDPLTSWRC